MCFAFETFEKESNQTGVRLRVSEKKFNTTYHSSHTQPHTSTVKYTNQSTSAPK